MIQISTNSKVFYKKCALCDGLAHQTYVGMSGYVEGTKYNVYECARCFTSFVDPMSNLQEEYEIIYGGDTTKDSATTYYYYLAQGVKQLKNPLKDLENFSAIFWGVGRALKDFGIKKGSKILEVGSGLGYLTRSLNKAGYKCEGLDYSETAVKFAKNFYGDTHTQGTISSFVNTDKNDYDVVIATEVIEHVVDPVLFVKECLSVLRVGGKLILTTPIKDIHPKGTIWETEPAPIHLWWFTEHGISAIGEQLGAGTTFVNFTEYTKNKIWHVHLGTAGTAPTSGPVMNKERHCIHAPQIGYKQRLMRILPAWMYIKLVCIYHDLKFLQKNKQPSRYMYGMCSVITKS